MITTKELVSLTGMTVNYFNVATFLSPFFKLLGFIIFIIYLFKAINFLFIKLTVEEKYSDIAVLPPIVDNESISLHKNMMNKALAEGDIEKYNIIKRKLELEINNIIS
jgi:hypothetical protein